MVMPVEVPRNRCVCRVRATKLRPVPALCPAGSGMTSGASSHTAATKPAHRVHRHRLAHCRGMTTTACFAHRGRRGRLLARRWRTSGLCGALWTPPLAIAHPPIADGGKLPRMPASAKNKLRLGSRQTNKKPGNGRASCRRSDGQCPIALTMSSVIFLASPSSIMVPSL